jgi:ATP-dependent DNA ligase
MKYLNLEHARAKSKKPDEFWGDPLWIAEEKWNGWREHYHFGKDLPRTFMTGRRTSTVTGMLSEKGEFHPQLWSDLKIGYTVMDCEALPPPKGGFRDMAKFFNSSAEEVAAAIRDYGSPRLAAFDLLFLDGEDIRQKSQLERKTLLRDLVPQLKNELIFLTPTLPATEAEYESIVLRGGEGVILKNIVDEYGEGWIKVKKFYTLDVVITGFTDAKFGRTGQYFGQIGAVKVSVYTRSGELLEVGKVSGMKDDVRRDMTDNPGRWLGSVIEIRAQEWAKDRLQSPRFFRARPDADPRHATWQKMQDDLKASIKTEGQQSLFR